MGVKFIRGEVKNSDGDIKEDFHVAVVDVKPVLDTPWA